MRFFVTYDKDIRRQIKLSLMDVVQRVNECIIELYLVADDSIKADIKTTAVFHLNNINYIPIARRKAPTEKQFYKWMYKETSKYITDKSWMTSKVISTETKYNVKVTTPIEKICADIDSISKDFYRWLSTQYSKHTYVLNRLAYNKLSELTSH